MSIFSKLFKKQEENTAGTESAEELTELPVSEEPVSQVQVVVEKISMLSDADRIIKKVRSGNIVIASIKELHEQNLDELKHAISKIRTSASVWNGDIAGVGSEWIIVTPSSARIRRGETA
jgi:SepF-like predicted cell division protein (DUF552 family)